jgi:polyferredoxin
MRKMGYPEGLIRYSTENALEKGWTQPQILRRTFRPRVLVYFAILAAIVAAAGLSLWSRVPIKMDVIRDRAALAREADDERIENVFQLRVMNTAERPYRFTLEVPATKHLRDVRLIADAQPIEIGPTSSKLIAARVQAKPHDAEGSQKIEFVLRTVEVEGRPVVLHENSRFLVPSSMVRKEHHDEH